MHPPAGVGGHVRRAVTPRVLGHLPADFGYEPIAESVALPVEVSLQTAAVLPGPLRSSGLGQYLHAVGRYDVVVLNGGSSAGKTTVARRLQVLLGPNWLAFSIDDLVRALPGGEDSAGVESVIEFPADGSVVVGESFRQAETAWYAGLAAMAAAGVGVILDDVFLSGSSSQRRIADAMRGLGVLWVGVRCDPGVATEREATRRDRIAGMARSQAEVVHQGVDYDLVVDTTAAAAGECANRIAARVLSGD